MIRDWLIGIVKQGLLEGRIERALTILAQRDPTKDDNSCSVGTIWVHDDKQFVLKSISAEWVVVEDKE